MPRVAACLAFRRVMSRKHPRQESFQVQKKAGDAGLQTTRNVSYVSFVTSLHMYSIIRNIVAERERERAEWLEQPFSCILYPRNDSSRGMSATSEEGNARIIRQVTIAVTRTRESSTGISTMPPLSLPMKTLALHWGQNGQRRAQHDV